MANLDIFNLEPAGSELFEDNENFLADLNDSESGELEGGYYGGYWWGGYGGQVGISIGNTNGNQVNISVGNINVDVKKYW
ncbi:MAG: hypothetical protein ACRC2R_25820 [Xenococcaceae cyanobacterium]